MATEDKLNSKQLVHAQNKILGVLLMARADWPLAASSGSAGRAQPGIARTLGRTGQQDTLSPRPNLLPESIPLLP